LKNNHSDVGLKQAPRKKDDIKEGVNVMMEWWERVMEVTCMEQIFSPVGCFITPTIAERQTPVSPRSSFTTGTT
jgi:hypothetical protein